MSTGYVYVVTSTKPDYEQEDFCSVPSEWKGRLYFGPCKKALRPRAQKGDIIVGISGSRTRTRKVLFAAEVEDIMPFDKAYVRLPPELRGENGGPIHVRKGRDGAYEHVPGAMHAGNWRSDITPLETRDRFLILAPARGWRNRWLGKDGPEVDNQILSFLKTCFVYNLSGRLGLNDARPSCPIAHGKLYTGLHLETDKPDELIQLIGSRMSGWKASTPESPGASPRQGTGSCEPRNSTRPARRPQSC